MKTLDEFLEMVMGYAAVLVRSSSSEGGLMPQIMRHTESGLDIFAVPEFTTLPGFAEVVLTDVLAGSHSGDFIALFHESYRAPLGANKPGLRLEELTPEEREEIGAQEVVCMTYFVVPVRGERPVKHLKHGVIGPGRESILEWQDTTPVPMPSGPITQA